MMTTFYCLLFLISVFGLIYLPGWFHRYRRRQLHTTEPKPDPIIETTKPDFPKGGVLTKESVEQIAARYRYGQPDKEGDIIRPGAYSPADEARIRNPEISTPRSLVNHIVSRNESRSIGLSHPSEEEPRKQDDYRVPMPDNSYFDSIAASLSSDSSSSDLTSSSSASSSDDSSSSSSSSDGGGGDFGGGGGGSDY